MGERFFIFVAIVINFFFFFVTFNDKRSNYKFSIIKFTLMALLCLWGTLILILLEFTSIPFKSFFNIEFYILLLMTSILFPLIYVFVLKGIEVTRNTLVLLFYSVISGLIFILIEFIYLNSLGLTNTTVDVNILLVAIIHTVITMFLAKRLIQQLRIDQYLNKKRISLRFIIFISFIIGHSTLGAIYTFTEAYSVTNNSDFFVIEFLTILILVVTTIVYGEKQYNDKSEKLNFFAYHDSLTKLYNRLFLNEKLEYIIEQKEHYYFLMIDIDDFKLINDKHGHHVGDLVIKEIANRLKKPTNNEDYVIRLGGDEFTILYKDTNDKLPVEEYTNLLIKNLSKPFILNEQTITLSCSIGIAKFLPDEMTVDDIMKQADSAMYIAKEYKDYNNYHFYKNKK